MASFSHKTVASVIGKIFPSLRKNHHRVLSLMITGICKARKGIMAEMARTVPGSKNLKYKARRFWRFVANKRFHPESLFRCWVLWVLQQFVKEKTIRIAIDWTEFPGGIKVLMAAVPFAHRAIPLYWHLTRNSAIVDSQNLTEHRFVETLIGLIPQGYRMILVADRAFGRAEFIQFLKQKKLLFVLRVKADVFITTKNKRNIKLRDHLLKPNIPAVFKHSTYREDSAVEGVTVIGITIADKKDDPWWLVTNLIRTEQAIRTYELRFDIEEWFRDLKHELDVDTIYTKRIERVKTILFAACVSYGLLVILGKLAKGYPAWIKQVVTSKAYSLVFLALRFIQENIPTRVFWYRFVRVATVATLPGG